MNETDQQNLDGMTNDSQMSDASTGAESINKSDLEEAFKVRLKKERQKSEESQKEAAGLKKQLEALQSKFESGKATSEESAKYINAKNTIDEAHSRSVPIEKIPILIKDIEDTNRLDTNIAEAAQKDPEFKALINDPASLQKVTRQEVDEFRHLPNPAAVLKHLLKDDRDRETLRATERAWDNGDGGTAFMQFVNNLSRQLEGGAKYPHPSNYTPAPNLDNSGQSDNFTVSGYISRKYK